MTQMHRTGLNLALLAGLAMGANTLAGERCDPEWDVTLGNPGMTGGYISAFVAHDDGSGGGEQLYATGSFTSAGAADTAEVARWNGTAWESVGGGLQGGYSNTIAVYQGDLIVGGYFDTAGSVSGTAKLARWDGTNWNSMDAQLESWMSSVWGLTVFDDGGGEDLYVLGNYVNIGGSGLDHIARWDGTEFTEVGGTIGGSGIPLIVIGGAVWDDGNGEALYVGGRFFSIAGVPANRIAKWDGTQWSALGDGIEGSSVGTGVYTMQVWDDGTGEALYVGGQSFTTAGGVPANRIAKWDGTEWSALGSGLDGTVWDMRVYDDGTGEALYVCGLFSNAGGVPASRFAKWDGTEWSAVGAGFDDDIFGAIIFEGNLVVGGDFLSADGLATERVATYVGCPTEIPGDLNGDGCVDQSDLGTLLAAYGINDGGDIDGDGDTDQADLGTLLGNYGQGC